MPPAVLIKAERPKDTTYVEMLKRVKDKVNLEEARECNKIRRTNTVQ